MTMTDAAVEAAPTPAPSGGDLWLAAVDALMDGLRENALHDLSLAAIATALGCTEEALREQFTDFDGLVVATLQVWSVRRNEQVKGVAGTFGTVALLRRLLEASVVDQAYCRLVIAAASTAASPGSAAAPPLRQLWVQFHAMIQRSLARDVETGREPSTMGPSHGAEQLLALYEGLQVQWLLRPHMDLLAAWDRATTRMRRGWSEYYAEPVWSI